MILGIFLYIYNIKLGQVMKTVIMLRHKLSFLLCSNQVTRY